MRLDITVLTLFPEMFPGPLGASLAGAALKKNLWSLNALNIRDFAEDKHQTVDDKPYGGGSGMVMRADVIAKAVDHALETAEKPLLIYPSPRGELFTQSLAEEMVKTPNWLFLCGRYEGVDERVLRHYRFREVSLGDFILSGGEIAALSMIDACLRLVPDVIRGAHALEEESFCSKADANGTELQGLLEYPLYTRPAEWQGAKVPEVLLSGHHEEVKKWRLKQAQEITKKNRPDLWAKYKG